MRPEPARPFFLYAGPRALFALHHVPASTPRGAVLYVPPFGEEMNKSRRMAALQARALAAAGWHVLQIDLTGTGDSEGEFADARWSAWLEDIAAARSWLAERTGAEPWLWGLRLGALLACQGLAERPAPGLLLWQPVQVGKQHLQQFLRLKAGAAWLAPGTQTEATARPMDELLAGRAVEVAGYMLDPALALPMADATLVLPGGDVQVRWFELAPHADAMLSPAGRRACAPLAGRARSAVLRGPSFWQTQEIDTSPELVVASTSALMA